MAWIVILSIITLPVIEIAIFVTVSDAIGLFPAIAGMVLAGLAGVTLWRHEGLRTLVRAQQAMDRGEAPVAEVLDGVCILLAGALLILPGFLSDIAALVLLLPPVRFGLQALLVSRMIRPAPPRPQPGSPLVIDAEFHQVDEDEHPKS